MSDPWLAKEETNQSSVIAKFEDNFASESQNNSNENNRLPDSDNYLKGLERKLEKLKKGSNLVEALAEKRQDCLRALLNQQIEGIQNNNENLLDLDAPINTDSIYRHLQPVQAISVGETVHIVKYDQLEEQQEANEVPNEEQETPDK